MLIGGLQKLSLIDYPGKVAAVIFTVGCNFRCPFCHNAELVNLGHLETESPSALGGSVSKSRTAPLISEAVFFDFLKTRIGKLDGVCVSGGEPILQPDLPDFLSKIKGLGFAVKLDTNGANPEILQRLIEDDLVDYVAMDIKTVVSSQSLAVRQYDVITGTKVDLNKIQRSAGVIKKYGIKGKVDYEFRTTVLPKFHTREDLIAMGEWLMSLSPTGKTKKYFLQNFRPEKTLDESLKNEKPFSSAELAEFRELLNSYFEYCGVRE